MAGDLLAVRPGVPIVWMSGYEAPGREPGDALHFARFLAKPFTLETLDAQIRSAL